MEDARRVCTACRQDKTRTCFLKRQWSKSDRRCNTCIADNRVSTAGAMTLQNGRLVLVLQKAILTKIKLMGKRLEEVEGTVCEVFIDGRGLTCRQHGNANARLKSLAPRLARVNAVKMRFPTLAYPTTAQLLVEACDSVREVQVGHKGVQHCGESWSGVARVLVERCTLYGCGCTASNHLGIPRIANAILKEGKPLQCVGALASWTNLEYAAKPPTLAMYHQWIDMVTSLSDTAENTFRQIASDETLCFVEWLRAYREEDESSTTAKDMQEKLVKLVRMSWTGSDMVWRYAWCVKMATGSRRLEEEILRVAVEHHRTQFVSSCCTKWQMDDGSEDGLAMLLNYLGKLEDESAIAACHHKLYEDALLQVHAPQLAVLVLIKMQEHWSPAIEKWYAQNDKKIPPALAQYVSNGCRTSSATPGWKAYLAVKRSWETDQEQSAILAGTQDEFPRLYRIVEEENEKSEKSDLAWANASSVEGAVWVALLTLQAVITNGVRDDRGATTRAPAWTVTELDELAKDVTAFGELLPRGVACDIATDAFKQLVRDATTTNVNDDDVTDLLCALLRVAAAWWRQCTGSTKFLRMDIEYVDVKKTIQILVQGHVLSYVALDSIMQALVYAGDTETLCQLVQELDETNVGKLCHHVVGELMQGKLNNSHNNTDGDDRDDDDGKTKEEDSVSYLEELFSSRLENEDESVCVVCVKRCHEPTRRAQVPKSWKARERQTVEAIWVLVRALFGLFVDVQKQASCRKNRLARWKEVKTEWYAKWRTLVYWSDVETARDVLLPVVMASVQDKPVRAGNPVGMWIIRHHPNPTACVGLFRESLVRVIIRSIKDVIESGGCPHAIHRLRLWCDAMAAAQPREGAKVTTHDFLDIVAWLHGEDRLMPRTWFFKGDDEPANPWRVPMLDILAQHEWFVRAGRESVSWKDALRWYYDSDGAMGRMVRENAVVQNIVDVQVDLDAPASGLEGIALLPLQRVLDYTRSPLRVATSLRLVSKAMLARVDEVFGAVWLGRQQSDAMVNMLQRRQLSLESVTIVHSVGVWAMYMVMQQGGTFPRLRRLVVDVAKFDIVPLNTDMLVEVLQQVAPRLHEFALYNGWRVIPALYAHPSITWPALRKLYVDFAVKDVERAFRMKSTLLMNTPTTGGLSRLATWRGVVEETAVDWWSRMMQDVGGHLTHVHINGPNQAVQDARRKARGAVIERDTSHAQTRRRELLQKAYEDGMGEEEDPDKTCVKDDDVRLTVECEDPAIMGDVYEMYDERFGASALTTLNDDGKDSDDSEFTSESFKHEMEVDEDISQWKYEWWDNIEKTYREKYPDDDYY